MTHSEEEFFPGHGFTKQEPDDEADSRALQSTVFLPLKGYKQELTPPTCSCLE